MSDKSSKYFASKEPLRKRPAPAANLNKKKAASSAPNPPPIPPAETEPGLFSKRFAKKAAAPERFEKSAPSVPTPPPPPPPQPQQAQSQPASKPAAYTGRAKAAAKSAPFSAPTAHTPTPPPPPQPPSKGKKKKKTKASKTPEFSPVKTPFDDSDDFFASKSAFASKKKAASPLFSKKSAAPPSPREEKQKDRKNKKGKGKKKNKAASKSAPFKSATKSGSINSLNLIDTESEQDSRPSSPSIAAAKATQDVEVDSAAIGDLIEESISKGETSCFGRGKLMVVGQGRSGKTTTIDSLLGRPFNKDQLSTVGAATSDLAVTVDTQDVQSWKKTDKQRSEASRAMAAGALAAKNKQRMKGQGGDKPQHEHGSKPDFPEDGERESEAIEVDVPEPEHADPHAEDAKGSGNGANNGDDDALDFAIQTLREDATLGDIADDDTAVTFKVFDLGGQSTFYVFHQFFLTKYAVYLVVFSMADALSPDESVRSECWEFLLHWLSSLYLYAQGAPIFLIGTYADVISSRKQHEAVEKQVFTRLNHHPIFEQVVRNTSANLWFWPVDNTRSISDPSIQDLQVSITAEANAQEFINMPVQITSLAFYDELAKMHKEKGNPCFTLEEVGTIAAKFRMSSKDTIAALQFWHKFGMLLYYDQVSGMDELVILDPQWAIDLMSKVIRNFNLHHLLEDKNARRHADLWRDLTSSAILDRRLLSDLWATTDDKVTQAFLDLMQRFGLIVSLADTDAKGSGNSILGADRDDPLAAKQPEDEGAIKYLIPTILPVTLDGADEIHNSTLSTVAGARLFRYDHKYAVKKRRKYSPAVYVSFLLRQSSKNASVLVGELQRMSFLPEGLFSRVLGRLVANSQYSSGQTAQISKTKALLYFTEYLIELELVPNIGGLRILVHAPRPRPLLRMVQDCITQTIRECYPELKCHTLLPYSKDCLLFLDDVIENHRNKRAVWIQRTKLKVKDIEARYLQWLPTTGLLSYYDAFVSYRQTANSNFAVNLQVGLEEQQLVSFLDANNLETGKNYKLSFMDAISKTLVACPIVSEEAISRMAGLAHRDACDNVLLEWWCMQALRAFFVANKDTVAEARRILLRRIVPLFVSQTWSNSQVTRGEEDDDSFRNLLRSCQSLPDTVSHATHQQLSKFFTEVLKIPAPKPRSVREIVSGLLDQDAILCFPARDESAQSHSNALKQAAVTDATSKWKKVPGYANSVREVVENTKAQLSGHAHDAYLQSVIDAARASDSSGSSSDEAEHEQDQDQDQDQEQDEEQDEEVDDSSSASDEDSSDSNDNANDNEDDEEVILEEKERGQLQMQQQQQQQQQQQAVLLPLGPNANDSFFNNDLLVSSSNDNRSNRSNRSNVAFGSNSTAPPEQQFFANDAVSLSIGSNSSSTGSSDLSKPLKQWSVEDVQAWLIQEQMPKQVIAQFGDDAIDGGVLAALTDTILSTDMNIARKVHRLKILQHRDAILKRDGVAPPKERDSSKRNKKKSRTCILM